MPSWLVVSKMCYFPTRKLDDPTLLSSGMAQPSSKNDGASDSPETGSEPAKTTSSRFQAIFCHILFRILMIFLGINGISTV